MTHPDKIGKYRILGLLGRGAVGVVYKAYQEDLQRTVALKVLLSGAHGSAETIKRFLREARAAAALSHPGIVQVFDVGSDANVDYIVMEFVDGTSLAELLKTRKPTLPEALDLTLRLAGALGTAHARGIVHRDIKPSNILLGADGTPKIADFGLATVLEEQERLTATGDILGTPWYMSPEQAFGSPEEVDARADLYSLGAVLYEMLTGRPPFDGARATAVLKKIETENVVSPSRVNPSLDPRLDEVVLRALEKDPSRRYATAGEFEEALRDARGPVSAGRRRRSASRAPWMALSAGLTAALVGVLLFHRPGPSGSPSPSGDPVASVRAILDLPSSDRHRKSRLWDALADLERSPTGEAAYWRSRALLDLGSTRRALESVSQAIEQGYDTSASRAHRIYLLFLRYHLLQASSRLTYLHPHSSLGLERELEVLGAGKASPDELLLGEAALLCMKGKYTETLDRTAGKTAGPVAVVRWTALVRRATDTEDNPGAVSRSAPARQELRSALDREPGHPQAEFLLAILDSSEKDRKNAPPWIAAGMDEFSARSADPFLCRAILFERRNRIDLLTDTLAIARRIDPEDPFAAAYAYAAVLSIAEDSERNGPEFAREVRAALSPIAARNPPFPAPYLLLATADLLEGKSKEGEELLRKTRLRFGGPDGWEDAKEWGRLEILADLYRTAGERGPRFLHARARLLSAFRHPSAEAVWRSLQDRIAAPDSPSDSSLDASALREIRLSIHQDLGAICAERGELDGVISHLRECVRLNGDLEDILEDPRFEGVRSHPRLKEFRKKP